MFTTPLWKCRCSFESFVRSFLVIESNEISVEFLQGSRSLRRNIRVCEKVFVFPGVRFHSDNIFRYLLTPPRYQVSLSQSVLEGVTNFILANCKNKLTEQLHSAHLLLPLEPCSCLTCVLLIKQSRYDGASALCLFKANLGKSSAWANVSKDCRFTTWTDRQLSLPQRQLPLCRLREACHLQLLLPSSSRGH